MKSEAIFNQTVERLRTARHVVISTGAGISAESGIATFRAPSTGLWSRYKSGELAKVEAFERNPALVWGWYTWRRMEVRNAQPNAAHEAVAALMQCLPRVTLITQNVDDLHERAGSKDAIHLHGHLATARCFTCSKPYLDTLPVIANPEAGPLDPPNCQHCGGLIRPNVVWFGEGMPQDELQRARAAVLDCDVMLSIGTSGNVAPAVFLPTRAFEQGAWVVHINLEASSTAAGSTLVGPATTWLPRLAHALIAV
ncbi:NAD-dependent protein deacylase [Pseudomonas nabeulensis]|uniref:NAD-dependent protein deacylase n=1 Tax=Pseudomonas nabeulensis TaxID=2293833 RepID=A0A4Z0AQ46_9PSED|nr:NAD-dependent protein deacylase [Pseudomonas nabeulensis]TFY88500.1 NAD-dependent protein deacylase [Pseudomonas nabeulensis]